MRDVFKDTDENIFGDEEEEEEEEEEAEEEEAEGETEEGEGEAASEEGGDKATKETEEQKKAEADGGEVQIHPKKGMSFKAIAIVKSLITHQSKHLKSRLKSMNWTILSITKRFAIIMNHRQLVYHHSVTNIFTIRIGLRH